MVCTETGQMPPTTEWKSVTRLKRALPTSFAEQCRPGETVAFRCTMPGCSACAEFESSGDRARFETHLKRSEHVDRIVEWNCGDRPQRTLALRAGVDHIPSYVIVRSSK